MQIRTLRVRCSVAMPFSPTTMLGAPRILRRLLSPIKTRSGEHFDFIPRCSAAPLTSYALQPHCQRLDREPARRMMAPRGHRVATRSCGALSGLFFRNELLGLPSGKPLRRCTSAALALWRASTTQRLSKMRRLFTWQRLSERTINVIHQAYGLLTPPLRSARGHSLRS